MSRYFGAPFLDIPHDTVPSNTPAEMNISRNVYLAAAVVRS